MEYKLSKNNGGKVLLLVAIIALLGFSSIGDYVSINHGLASPSRGAIKNHHGNIINSGIVASNGDEIFFWNGLEEELCKISADGSGYEVISNIKAGFLNVVGEFLYFRNMNNRGSLSRMDLSSYKIEHLSLDSCMDLQWEDPWFYYRNAHDENRIYKIRSDGSMRSKISTDSADYLYLSEGWLYYRNTNINGGIYRIKTDGTGRKRIYPYSSSHINVQGKWVYFINRFFGSQIYKVSIEGTGATRIINDFANNLNVQNDWIYYTHKREKSLYRARIDGSDRQMITDNPSWNIQLIADDLYYYNDLNGLIYSMKTDGTHQRAINFEHVRNDPLITAGFGNISNGGLVAAKGEWLYYCCPIENKYHIYKIHIDGTQKQKLTSDCASGLNIVGDWLYYLNRIGRTDYIYKIKTDGTGRTALSNTQTSDLFAEKGWMHFFYSDGINRSRTTHFGGSTAENHLINDDRIVKGSLNIRDNWMYYINYGEGSAIYRSNSIDGLGKRKLGSDAADHLIEADGWLYYRNSKDFTIYKIDIEGSQKIQISDIRTGTLRCSYSTCSNSFNICGSWIFFNNADDKLKLYKMSIDGSSVLKISDHAARNIIVLDDWVYYTTRHDNKNCIFKVRKNGTGRKLIDSQETIIKKNNRGNSLGNIVNEGIAVIQDDWIYYRNIADQGRIYKIHVNGSDAVAINDHSSFDINIFGSWIYYRNYTDGNKLYKVSIDGKRHEMVHNGISFNLNVVDNWIYFKNGNHNGNLFKIRIDGTELTQVNHEHASKINVVEPWVYYQNSNISNYIYRMGLDGKDNARITMQTADFINFDGGWIYFCNVNDNGKLYRIHTSGKNLTKLLDISVTNLNVDHDWIYFSSVDEKGHAYRFHVDDKALEKINHDQTASINIAGPWMYYRNLDDYGKLYRIKTDGTERQLVK